MFCVYVFYRIIINNNQVIVIEFILCQSFCWLCFVFYRSFYNKRFEGGKESGFIYIKIFFFDDLVNKGVKEGILGLLVFRVVFLNVLWEIINKGWLQYVFC